MVEDFNSEEAVTLRPQYVGLKALTIIYPLQPSRLLRNRAFCDPNLAVCA